MDNREKVIKWLEYDYLPRVGAYRKDCKQGCDACMPMHDGDGYCDIDMLCKILTLLKEQEAVEPKTGHWIVLEYCANEGIYCSECHMKIFDRITKPKKKLSQYCPHCGSRNDQFFRDGEVVFR